MDLGRDSDIGPGFRIVHGCGFVTGDVAPYTIIGGNPMRVLRTDALLDVINPATLPE
jgi:acetyltransferase-like isoleucine patch superfamily enzyme